MAGVQVVPEKVWRCHKCKGEFNDDFMEHCARCTLSYCALCDLIQLDQLPTDFYPDAVTNKTLAYVETLRKINPYRSCDFFCPYCIQVLKTKVGELGAWCDVTKGKMY
jgi:hypothetical protein